MGSTQSGEYSSPGNKRVVIIGASFGGKILAGYMQLNDKTFKNCEILFIDKNEHFEFICSIWEGYKSAEGFKENTAKFTDMVAGFKNDKVKFKQAKLTNVLADANQIEIDNPDGSKESVHFDALVLSTGASYTAPWRGPDEILTQAQREAEMGEVRAKIQAASSILCVGAGPTGLETAGYLKDTYPDKRIGICQRGKVLLPVYKGAHELLLKALEEMKVDVLLGQAYSPDNELGFEFVLDCRGFKYQGPSGYMQGALAECIDKKTGQIWVDKYGRVNNKHPIASNHQPANGHVVYKNIFSIGDVCLTPSNEEKSIVSIYQYAPHIAHNIQQTLAEKSSFKEIPMDFTKICSVPLCGRKGVMAFNKMVVPQDDAMKVKLETRDGMIMAYKGKDQQAINKENAKLNQMGTIVGVTKGCCCCLPIHINKIKAENQKKFLESKKMFESQY